MSESESDSDVPGAAGSETVCPVCASTASEEIFGGDLDYRCLDCGARFDPTAGHVNVE